jgi:hypothetical protein
VYQAAESISSQRPDCSSGVGERRLSDAKFTAAVDVL